MSSLFPTYKRKEFQLEKGSGTYVFDENNKRYLDFTSGIAVTNLGHCHPEVVSAIQDQSEKIWHTSNLFKNDQQEVLAETLVKNTPLDLAFFCNSGAEANEAAIKLAKKYTGKNKIITFKDSFHGRTFGAMSATGQQKVKDGYGELISEFVHLPWNETEELSKIADEDTAAIMMEVFQGEGGVRMADLSFYKEIQKICDDNHILLIVDEVQTGIGRTGKRYAYDHFDLHPDIVTLAKGLGNGFPIGAMLGKEILKTAFGPGSHGTTFGGSPLACSVGQTVLNIIFQEDFLHEVECKGNNFMKVLKDSLHSHPLVKEVRGKGLLIGIECERPVGSFIEWLEEQGLLTVPAGENVIRLLPPLTVSEEELETAAGIISQLFKQFHKVST
ncbi:acetylornithine transaminase [Fictibacillus phosphorivorans]|uniref:acetylornithine transaminase n=1 Tax=Fictibacillus phosphorivorans TaxID=1221500 RepID=UPI002041EE50|nr:acetylornithine transaminase [Fictibacillus phosphorivorans]MCM3718777.1 acetylornithine transaminase [Fictibacillus phosphorivorans]MCM3776400.1 acetylornithine transaminase [Fictibacillus phosphorivorans]